VTDEGVRTKVLQSLLRAERSRSDASVDEEVIECIVSDYGRGGADGGHESHFWGETAGSAHLTKTID